MVARVDSLRLQGLVTAVCDECLWNTERRPRVAAAEHVRATGHPVRVQVTDVTFYTRAAS